MTRKSRVFAGCVLGGIALVAGNKVASADDVDGKVDAFVKSELQRQRIPGVAVGVYRDGRLTKAQGYGLANVEWDAAVTPDTIFQSGSVGKQFTATAVMMLVEQGKVALDDPISKYLRNGPPVWDRVTIRQLLSHTAGFTDYPESFDLRRDWTEDEL